MQHSIVAARFIRNIVLSFFSCALFVAAVSGRYMQFVVIRFLPISLWMQCSLSIHIAFIRMFFGRHMHMYSVHIRFSNDSVYLNG